MESIPPWKDLNTAKKGKNMKTNMKGKIALIAMSALTMASLAVGGPRNSNGVTHSAGHGNSAFGLKQGNSTTRTKGVQNSQYGRNTAASHKPTPNPTP